MNSEDFVGSSMLPGHVISLVMMIYSSRKSQVNVSLTSYIALGQKEYPITISLAEFHKNRYSLQ